MMFICHAWQTNVHNNRRGGVDFSGRPVSAYAAPLLLGLE
jgi:hypothetical protein